jgi:hypothetical protein
MLVAQVAGFDQEFIGKCENAAFAHDRLKQNRRRPVRHDLS